MTAPFGELQVDQLRYMAKQHGSGTAGAPSGGAGLGGLIGGLLGGRGGAGGGLSSILDANGDGNPLDDILRMAARRGR